MPFGVVDKIYHEDFLLNQPCQSCGSNFENKLIIYCKAFMTGPITWWAWGKRGYVECVSCGTMSDIHPFSKEFKEARYIYSRKGAPLHYFIPTIVFGGIFLLITLAIFIGFVYNISTTSKEKLQGIWVTADGQNSIFFFNNNQYTLLAYDTILFGRYNVDKGSGGLDITIRGTDNNISSFTLQHLPLDIDGNGSFDFSKTINPDKGENPYEKKFNHWRIKATREESNEELKDRVMSYLYYLKLRYEWAMKNNLTYLPADLYSPVLQAQKGIGVYEASMPYWKPIFYSEENYLTASKFLYYSFPTKHHINEKETNVFKRNLEAIDAYIESAKRRNIE